MSAIEQKTLPNSYSFSKKDIKDLIHFFREGQMIESFYDDLFSKLTIIHNKSQSSDKKSVIKQEDQSLFSLTDVLKYILRIVPTFDPNCVTKSEYIQKQTEIKHVINCFFVDLLEKHPPKALTKISTIHTFTLEEMNTMIPGKYAEFDSFLVIGCPDSTDIDVICFVGESDHSNGSVKELSPKSISDLKLRINSLGYDTLLKVVDINCVYVDPTTRSITASSKGGTETQNIINATWKYHKQEVLDDNIPIAIKLHPVVDIEFSHKEIYDKLRAFAKYVLDHAVDITDYKIFRPIKTKVYSSEHNESLRFMSKVKAYLIINPKDALKQKLDLSAWHDRFKALSMKLLQILLLNETGETCYIKSDLAKTVKKIFHDIEDKKLLESYEQCSMWYLFRGKKGTFISGFFELLLDRYNEIVDDHLNSTLTTPLVFSKDYVMEKCVEHKLFSKLSVELLEMFIDSPVNVTPEFEQKWEKEKLNLSKINSLFHIKSSDPVTFFKLHEKTDPKLVDVFKRHFIFVDQRSDAWLDMLNNKYVCGRNSVVIDETSSQSKYNLIRGAIIELIAMDMFNVELLKIKHDHDARFSKLHLGFIVEEDKKGARGFAPDLVVMIEHKNNEGQIISTELVVVEIKGLKSLKKNADYYRGYHLASKQIKSVRDVIKSDSIISQRGVILLCSIEDQQFKMEVHNIEY